MAILCAPATCCFTSIPALRPSISAALSGYFSSSPYLASGPVVLFHANKAFFRLSSFEVRASSPQESPNSLEVGELFLDFKEKLDGLENKSTVLVYGGGAVVAVWLCSVVIGAINSVPLLPIFMELVGIGYSGWFVYRYLLYESSRKELATDFDALKKIISSAIE